MECYELANKKLLTGNQFLSLRDTDSEKKERSNDITYVELPRGFIKSVYLLRHTIWLLVY